MTPRLVAVIGGLTVVAAVVGGVLFVWPSRWYGRSTARASAAGAPAAPSTAGRRIKAHLFYVDADGTRLSSVERDVAFGEGTVEQARQIIEAQIGPVAEPLVSAVPPGTRLRTLFVTDRGEAFVDFSRELLTGHSGGSTNELLTVYTVVDALTANLPAVTAVQLLVDGKQVETLAGHVDLRRPLAKNLAWVQ
jgi:spore germination protein GerM